MAALTSQDYLETHCQWQATHENDEYVLGLCPVHTENTPSFRIYKDDDHWYCFGCKQTGDVKGLIRRKEFGHIAHEKYAFALANERYKELTGEDTERPASGEKRQIKKREIEKANEPQRAVLTAAMNWWHGHLWEHDTRYGSPRGQTYLRIRGGDLVYLGDQLKVGYAPAYNARTEKKLHDSFESALFHAVGKEWKEIARYLGLLWEDGHMALRDRVMLCSTLKFDGKEECVFYQGRSVELRGDPKPRYKYMNTWNVQHYPFMLPVARPRVRGTTHTESRFGPIVFASNDVFSAGWDGGSFLATVLAGLPKPDLILMDNDTARKRHDGSLYYPGQEHACAFVELSKFLKREHYVAFPPQKWKDPDTWVRQDGINPYLFRAAEFGLLVPSYKEEEDLVHF